MVELTRAMSDLQKYGGDYRRWATEDPEGFIRQFGRGQYQWTVNDYWANYHNKINEYNNKLKEYATLTGDAYNPITSEFVSRNGILYNSAGKQLTPDDAAGYISALDSKLAALNDQIGYAGEGEARNEKRRTDFTSDPLVKPVIDAINASLAKGEPEFTPESVSEWTDKLNEIYQPYQDQAIKTLNEQYNFSNPYGLGSGNQMSAIGKSLADFSANKGQTALGLAQNDYSKKYDTWQSNLNKSLGLGQYLKSDVDQNNWQNLQRTWNINDASQKRSWDLQDYNMQADLAKQLAEMSKPQSNWYDPLVSAAGTGLGLATGGAGYGYLSKLFGK